MSRWLLLLSSIIQIHATCFESAATSVPRVFIRSEPGIWTEGCCRALCFNDTDCLAVQYSASSKNCVLLGEKKNGSQCGADYHTFVKQAACATPIPQPVPPPAFTSTGCQDAEDIVDVQLGILAPCPAGMTPAGKQPYVVDVVLSDGTRDFYPSNKSTIVWDADVGSLKLLFNNLIIFVANARCSRAPGNPSSSCTCGSVPPTGPQGTQTDEVSPYLNVLPSCPAGYNLWVYYLQELGAQPSKTPSIQYRKVFCGMGTMQYDNLIQPGDNPDLTKERKTASFSVWKMQCFVYEGEEVVKRRKEILDFVQSTPEFEDPIPTEFLTREELAVAMTDKIGSIGITEPFGEGLYYQSLILPRDFHAMSLHSLMFMPTIMGQSDEEQAEQWMGPTAARAILGTYAQTEMGHGTNLANLETTATYDSKTEEFVLHTPTLSATKWWPGGLGKSSNVAVVMAQLYTNGQCKGPHPFYVPLRDPDTHMPLKGITLGDIGPKFGFNASDNGFLIFDNYRIPRRNMFMRFSKVLPDGTYVPPAHTKLGYGTMVFVRAIIVKDQSILLGASAVIGIRYSAVRRQGEINEGAGEVQVIDYRTQQLRLLPQLARAFAFLFAAYEIKTLYLNVTEQIGTGNIELLPELHAITSGLKAVVTWETAQGIEQLRLACGGHGYSCASAFPEIYSYAVSGCTLEGENIVLLLQVARYLMKCAKAVRAGNPKLASIGEYIARENSGKARVRSWKQCTDDDIIHDFETVARRMIFSSYDRLKSCEATMTKKEAWNKCSIDLCKTARMHVKSYLVKVFFRRVATCEDASCRKVMHTLATMYAFDLISSASGHFMKGGFMTEQQSDLVQADVYEMLEVLRPDAVALADSWDMSDLELRSVLGRRDGNVYPALLEWAKKSQLNRTEVLPTFEKYLGPMMKEGRSHL